MYKQDLDTCRTLSLTQERYGWPEYINVATGKNKKERVLEASTILGGALRLSGSVQSLDKEVLGNIKGNALKAIDFVKKIDTFFNLEEATLKDFETHQNSLPDDLVPYFYAAIQKKDTRTNSTGINSAPG